KKPDAQVQLCTNAILLCCIKLSQKNGRTKNEQEKYWYKQREISENRKSSRRYHSQNRKSHKMVGDRELSDR
ncbi:hypothetical protein, partial [Escherichia coli]|uniref:hypothetical protein n=1 Tax=Escherichia coli TaxID=562 RepID=UPI001BDCF656